MIASEVVQLYEMLTAAGVSIWIDGGWCVDALLGEQTRAHSDLDIAIQQKDVAKLREALAVRGYQQIRLEQARAWNFVLGDAQGREVDAHVIVLDDHGNGTYGPAANGEMYPAAALTGTGVIERQSVRCISPEWTVKFHSGYELKEKDFRDVSALCARFGMALPPEYERFLKAVTRSPAAPFSQRDCCD